MEFMGKNALFPEGPFYLAAKFKVPVSYVFAMKESKFHYHFFATPSKVYETPSRKINDKILKPLLKDYIAAFENALRKYPKEWFNYYKFWNEWCKKKLNYPVCGQEKLKENTGLYTWKKPSSYIIHNQAS